MQLELMVVESSDAESPPAAFTFPLPFALFPFTTGCITYFRIFYRKLGIDYEEH